jgi:predicted extracellular nuclease
MKFIKTTTFISFLIAIFFLANCKRNENYKADIVFYNVENLFDTIDDPLKNDKDFLPDGRNKWNSEKFFHKLENISKVLSSIDSNNLPAIIGLSEVENIEVIRDLINTGDLKNGNYKIVHYESPDERGIDVAMIYREKYFFPQYQKAIEIVFPFKKEEKTRDILYVKGNTDGGEVLHIFVNHWSSRWGGKEKSKPMRLFTASILKKYSDSLLKNDKYANIIILGDLNDNPDNESVYDILKAEKPLKQAALNNLLFEKYSNGEGTLFYKDWDMFDQIIVSSNLIEEKLICGEVEIFNPEWILFKTKEGEFRPNRTQGRHYYGGYSDHLPVYFSLDFSR